MNRRPALLLPAERGLFRPRRAAGRPGRKLRRAQCSGRGTDGACSVNDAGEQAGAADERTGGAINGGGVTREGPGTTEERRGAGGNGAAAGGSGQRKNPRHCVRSAGATGKVRRQKTGGRAISRRCLRRGEADQQKNGAQFAVCGRLRPVCVMREWEGEAALPLRRVSA